MVYRGRPSRACLSCRSRRIKCDRKPLGCTQCSRMRISCPGYRNPLDEDFRDETIGVVRKAEASYQKKKDRCTRPSSSLSPENADPMVSMDLTLFGMNKDPDPCLQDLAMINGFMGWNLPQPTEDVAVTNFLESYIPGSHFDYLPHVYLRDACSSPLSATVRAVSMAILSRELGDFGILDSARKTYSIALSETNAALADPTSAINDYTLVSVLLLSLFEALVCRGLGTPSNWTTHTRGALSLLQLRGQDQFTTDLGRQLFRQTTSILCVDAMQRRVPLPPGLVQLVSTAVAIHDENPKLRIATLIGEVAEFSARLSVDEQTPEEMIQWSLHLDKQCEHFANHLPPSCRYTEISVPECSEVYGSIIHQYPSHRMSRLWNSLRLLRNLLNDVIHRNTTHLLEHSSEPDQWIAIHEQAARNVEVVMIDMCASFPQFAYPSKFDKLGVSIPPKAAIPSYLWPLSAVLGSSLAPEGARLYVQRQLRWIGKEFRVPQAEKVVSSGLNSDVLRNGLHMFYVS